MNGINYLMTGNKYELYWFCCPNNLLLSIDPSSFVQMYLDAAEQEREKYVQELAAYKQTEAYRLFNEQQKKKMKTSTATTTDDVSI